MQEVYQQLTNNAEERGDVRRQLLETQAELAEARSELELWTQNGGHKSNGPTESETGLEDPEEQQGVDDIEVGGDKLEAMGEDLIQSLQQSDKQSKENCMQDEVIHQS